MSIGPVWMTGTTNASQIIKRTGSGVYDSDSQKKQRELVLMVYPWFLQKAKGTGSDI